MPKPKPKAGEWPSWAGFPASVEGTPKRVRFAHADSIEAELKVLPVLRKLLTKHRERALAMQPKLARFYAAWPDSPWSVFVGALESMLLMLGTQPSSAQANADYFATLYSADPDLLLEVLTEIRKANKRPLRGEEKAEVALRTLKAIGGEPIENCKAATIARHIGVAETFVKAARRKIAKTDKAVEA